MFEGEAATHLACLWHRYIHILDIIYSGTYLFSYAAEWRGRLSTALATYVSTLAHTLMAAEAFANYSRQNKIGTDAQLGYVALFCYLGCCCRWHFNGVWCLFARKEGTISVLVGSK